MSCLSPLLTVGFFHSNFYFFCHSLFPFSPTVVNSYLNKKFALTFTFGLQRTKEHLFILGLILSFLLSFPTLSDSFSCLLVHVFGNTTHFLPMRAPLHLSVLQHVVRVPAPAVTVSVAVHELEPKSIKLNSYSASVFYFQLQHSLFLVIYHF